MLNKTRVPKQLLPQIEEYADAFDSLPCTVIIHDLRDWSVIYMSHRGLALLQSTKEEITELSSGEYYKLYFNQEDAEDYVPKILSLLERNNDEEMVTYFQQVRFPGKEDWNWHMSSTKIFMRDDNGNPATTITISVPLDAMHHMTAKAERLLQENNFLRKNYEKFSALTRREKEVLTHVALGKSAGEIAAELFISVATAETHRKNIKQKLNASTYDLMQYARAFDLV
ncbi:response regulator transcription factor [Mucilaginibacter sp. AK015]|uniref:response regulator transcription factor n=1 Tax=Mucilaginibacter sp. AK015 TaxID=2723072 RepID=UPI0017926CB6|nr:helix-turn-helix transcriptional regulator [Mucilaginibacter sp. AK015]MBB5397346.1 DNA-binding CsgD family transcriptional regulator [Mucilaginibacter sp. AK015]